MFASDPVWIKRIKIMEPKEKETDTTVDPQNIAGQSKQPEPVVDPLKEKDEIIAKLAEERDNYKKVALKRLGKLPGDDDFINNGEGETLSVAEQIRLALLDREIENAKRERERADAEEKARLKRENEELRLALKNRPDLSIGGDSGTAIEVKDNVFSKDQLDTLRARAMRIGADPEKFIEKAKANFKKQR